MSTTPLSNLKLNRYQVIKSAGLLLLLTAIGIVAVISYQIWKPVKFQTTGGATPQEKVLNEALELLTNQTAAPPTPPGN